MFASAFFCSQSNIFFRAFGPAASFVTTLGSYLSLLPGSLFQRFACEFARGDDPLIWRQVEAPTSITLTVLHDIIQAAVGWCDCHLWEFTIGKQRYVPPELMDEAWGRTRSRPSTVCSSSVGSWPEQISFDKFVVGVTGTSIVLPPEANLECGIGPSPRHDDHIPSPKFGAM